MEESIQGAHLVAKLIGRWNPCDLAYVENFEYDALKARLTIRTLFQSRDGRSSWPDPDGPLHRVVLCFDGVSGLRLRDLGSGLVQIVGFEIVSLADRGWESLRFEVEDYEDGRIGFQCSDITVTEVVGEAVYLE